MVQLSYKVMSAHTSLASFTHVTHKYYACHSQLSRVLLTSISRVTKLRVQGTTVYFHSSFSLQVTSELDYSTGMISDTLAKMET